MTLEGWRPQIGGYLTLAEVIEFAFDYRGNTTIVKTDGTEVAGYIFNRDRRAPVPFVQFFDEAGDGPFTLPYAEISTILFTGKDTAAGNSWKAWLERREREKSSGAPEPAQQESFGAPVSGAPVRARDPHSHGA
jgi:hypothetical protein